MQRTAYTTYVFSSQMQFYTSSIFFFFTMQQTFLKISKKYFNIFKVLKVFSFNTFGQNLETMMLY